MKNKLYFMLCTILIFQFLMGCKKNPSTNIPSETTQIVTEHNIEEVVDQTTENVATEVFGETIEVKVYFGHLDKDLLVYKAREVTISEDEKPEEFFTRVLKENLADTETLVKAIPNDATIQKIEVKEDKAYVDMSKDYPYMNYGGGGEWLALQSLVNTIGHYYDVDEVVLTVDGEPYASGHILLEAGEGIKVLQEVEVLE